MAGLLVQNQNPRKRMEKQQQQIGCISGLLHIFDRQQTFAGGKRIQRLPPSTVVGASPETVQSPEIPSENATPLIPMSEPKEEAPRLSLDSRANSKPPPVVVGGDENQQRSPSVIARLMGLEPLSSLDSDHKSPQKLAAGKPTLKKSASESRVSSRDLCHSKYIDGNNFQVKQPKQSTVEHNVRDDDEVVNNPKSESSRTSPWKSSRRSSFDSEDFFPETNGGFEKKLRTRRMDEQQSNDLGALKQILEVLQLKGLLHSTTRRPSNRNFVYVRNLPSDESSIVLMKPWRSSKADNQRSVNDSRVMRRENSLKREGGGLDRRSPARARNSSSPTRIESNLKSCNSIVKRKPLSIEIQRRANESSDSLRSSPINSPKRTGLARNNRSPRNQKPSEASAINSPKPKIFKKVVKEDESYEATTVCTPPTTTEGNRHGRSLLQRCDKLLHNIAEMNSTESPPPISTTVLPSPVSVLDSVFDKDESSSPSHSSIDFKVSSAVDYEDESYTPSISPTKSTQQHEQFFISNDSDFLYISEILRISPYLQQHEEFTSDRTVSFTSVEKQLNNINNNDTSNAVSKRHRKLVFDVIVEILDRKKSRFPPWKKNAASVADSGSLKQIWLEFEKIREVYSSSEYGDGMMDVIRGVLRKDLMEIKGWIDDDDHSDQCMSEAIVLEVERMIFKDLVNEAIGDLAEFPAKCVVSRIQRRLVF